MTYYLRVSDGTNSVVLKGRPGETFTDTMDRGAVLLIDTYGTVPNPVLTTERVPDHEVADLMRPSIPEDDDA